MLGPHEVRERLPLAGHPASQTPHVGVWSGRAVAGVLVAATLTAAAWLPFLHHPLESDEAGFLLLGRHWSPGTSLYGDYWVDRPPLLIWLFAQAARLGPVDTSAVGLTAPAVKLLGAIASSAAVVITGLMAGLVAPESRWSRRGAVVVAAAFLSSPLLGMPEANGEVLAVPFVLLGLTCLIAALQRPSGRGALLLAGTAGASAMCAALVKQNVVDVFVFGAVAVVLLRGRVYRLWARAAAFVTGSVVVLGVALGAAAARGTSPLAVWDAIVVFRLQASTVIGSSASSATPERFWELVWAFLGSGGAAVLTIAAVLVLVGRLRRRGEQRPWISSAPASVAQDLAWAALAMVGWELCGVAFGGSYWLHYLTGLVPGTVLLLSLARGPRRWGLVVGAAVAYTVIASITTWAATAIQPVEVSSDAQVSTYLRDHAAPSDSVIVAFGHPGIVAASGMTSPYEHLWSLPVRVRDPRLLELQRVLSGPDAPAWIVVAGEEIDTWGLDARAADAYLLQHYAHDATYDDWTVWHRIGAPIR